MTLPSYPRALLTGPPPPLRGPPPRQGRPFSWATQTWVSLLFIFPSTRIQGRLRRLYGKKKTFRSAVRSGSTLAYASLVGEGDRASGGGGPRVARVNKSGGQNYQAISDFVVVFCEDHPTSNRSSRATHRTPSATSWPSSPTREAIFLGDAATYLSPVCPSCRRIYGIACGDRTGTDIRRVLQHCHLQQHRSMISPPAPS